MDVTWSQLKSIAVARKLSVQYLDMGGYYHLELMDGNFVLECEMDKNPSDTTDLTDFETNFKPDGNISTGRQSIKLMLAKGKANTVLATGIADVAIKIPGTFGVNAAGTLNKERTISGGSASFVNTSFGDYVKAEVRDDDNLLGLGAGTVLDTFHDLGVAAAEAGWWFLGRPIDLYPVVGDDPTDLPAGMYLHVIGYKGGTLPLLNADTFYVNIHWGKRIR